MPLSVPMSLLFLSTAVLLILPSSALDEIEHEESLLLSALHANLAELRDFDLRVITSTNKSNSLFSGLFEDFATSASSLDPAGTDAFPRVEDCSQVPARPILGNVDRRSILFFSWLEEPSDVLRVVGNLAATLVDCPADVRAGYLRNDNLVAFYGLESEEVLLQSVFSRFETVRHPHVAAFRRIAPTKLLSSRYDLFSGAVRASSVWTAERRYRQLRDLFPRLDMNGFTLRVSSIPFGFLTNADEDQSPEDPRRRFSNQIGYEVTLAKTACELLNCNLEFSNPEDMLWGTIDNGTFTGHFGDLAARKVDMVMTGIILTYARAMSGVFTTLMGSDGLTFLSPKPRPYRSFFTISYPLGPVVWATVLALLLAIPLLMFTVSNVEERVIPGLRLRQWSLLGQAAWYAFGTLIGESITRDTRSERAWALRSVVGGWLLFSFILTASYGGNLRAFFMTPKYTEPVENMLDVVESGLPWTMTITGEEIETYLANTEEPVEQQLWAGKTVVPYSDFPHKEMRRVFEGKQIMVEWKPIVDLLVGNFLTRSNGDLTVHYTDTFITPMNSGHRVWMYYPINPFLERFDPILHAYKESGVRTVWMAQAMAYFSERYREEYDMEPLPLDVDGDGDFSKMDMGDLFGLFVCFAGIAGASFVGFLAEVAVDEYWNGGKKLRRARLELTSRLAEAVQARPSLSLHHHKLNLR